MSDPSSIRVLFAGAARHATSYIDVLEARPDVAVVGVVEEPTAPDWARRDGRALAAAHGIPYEEDLAGLESPDAELVVVCSEPVRHARLAIAALGAGKSVLVDKPMATSLVDATAVLAAAGRARGRMTVVNRLASPVVRRARHWVDQGYAGFPRHLNVELLSNGSMFDRAVERPELVADPAVSGGGELRNFMVYAIDAVRYLTGCEVVSVYAEAGSFFFPSHRRFSVEDLGVVSLQLEYEVTATLLVGRVPQPATSGGAVSRLQLIGSHGHFAVDEESPWLGLWRKGESMVRVPITGAASTDPVAAVVDELIDALRQDRPPTYGAGDGWAAVAATDAAYRSIELGQPVDVPRRDEEGTGG